MTGEPGAYDGEVEALIVDRYLESLLARTPADPAGVPDHLRATASRLAVALPRFHPSFRFEEALAARLAAAARRTEGGELMQGPWVLDASSAETGQRGLGRPAVIGGVVTSAALSIAGAAYVAWRRRQPVAPMRRAVRAVARARLT